jgi:hypothetical protein
MSADTDYRFGTGLIFENDSDDLETNSDEVWFVMIKNIWF